MEKPEACEVLRVEKRPDGGVTVYAYGSIADITAGIVTAILRLTATSGMTLGEMLFAINESARYTQAKYPEYFVGTVGGEPDADVPT